MKIGYEESICMLIIKTYKGKSLNCVGSIEPLNKKEYIIKLNKTLINYDIFLMLTYLGLLKIRMIFH